MQIPLYYSERACVVHTPFEMSLCDILNNDSSPKPNRGVNATPQVAHLPEEVLLNPCTLVQGEKCHGQRARGNETNQLFGAHSFFFPSELLLRHSNSS